MIRGQFVCVYPYHGGWSGQRIRRAVYPDFVAMAVREGVTLLEHPTYRLDRTPQGVFLVVQARGTTRRPGAEVGAAAAQMAGAHQASCPHLSEWITQHTQEVAA